jgi:hypothetical protein
MKTTVELSDALLYEVRAVAAREGTTVRALLEDGLRHALAARRRRAAPFRLRDASVGGKGLRPELRNATWAELRDIVYGLPRS